MALIRMRLLVMLGVVWLAACSHGYSDTATLTQGGDGSRGRELIRSYGCGSCHTIPGVTGAVGVVGPNLNGIATRAYIAGVVPNQPRYMMQWILDPPGVDSKTAMPNLHVTARDARDIAAYLYTLE